MAYRIDISSDDIIKIEKELKWKGLQLDAISHSINGFAIADVSIIESEDEDSWLSSFKVIINVKKKTVCKFEFYGHKTNGVKILAKPKIGRHFIFDACFDIEFISTIDGVPTQYILVSYLDFDPNYRCDEDDNEGYIYTTIYRISDSDLTFVGASKFRFEDCYHYNNSIEVCQIDMDEACIFAYKQLSKCEFDSEYDIKREYMYDFDGIWNTSLYCTEKRIIPLNGEDFLDLMYEIQSEILAEISAERERERWERYEIE